MINERKNNILMDRNKKWGIMPRDFEVQDEMHNFVGPDTDEDVDDNAEMSQISKILNLEFKEKDPSDEDRTLEILARI